MSDNYPNLYRSSNKRFSEILSEGFRLFGKNLTLILPLGLFFIISLVITNLLIVDLNWQVLDMTPAIDSILSNWELDPTLINISEIELMGKYLVVGLLSIFLDILIPNIFNVIAICLVSNYIYNRFVGKETKLFPELKKALNKRMLMVILLLGVLFSAGWMVFIPGIIIFGFFIFYVFTYQSNDSEHPLKDARYLAKGEFWKIIGILIINNLIIMSFETAYHLILDFTPLQNSVSWYDPSTRDYGSIILYDFTINIVQLLFTPLLICLLTPLYAHLKTRKEQYLTAQTSYLEAPRSFETPSKEVLSDSGLYCPFCGKYSKVKYAFCLHCREKLDFELT